MLRSTAAGLVIALGQALASATAAPGDPPPGEPLPSSGYKVAFWFRGDRPAQTLRYQVYDLSKREYDPRAVGQWLSLIKARFPGYSAYVKDINPAPGPGRAAPEALTTAIHRETERIMLLGRRAAELPDPRAVPSEPGPGRAPPAAPPNAVGHSSPPAQPPTNHDGGREASRIPPPADLGRLMNPGGSAARPAGRTGIGGPYGGSSGFRSSTSSPFPVPYPRPHP